LAVPIGGGDAIAGGGKYMNTGADSCTDSTNIPLEVGPVGSPAITTIFGDSTPATAGGCASLIGVATW
jgi:hypothetical protein